MELWVESWGEFVFYLPSGLDPVGRGQVSGKVGIDFSERERGIIFVDINIVGETYE